MRKHYNIKIEKGHEAHLIIALENLGRDHIIFPHDDDYTMFTVELSKYELLFLRLASKSGEFMKAIP